MNIYQMTSTALAVLAAASVSLPVATPAVAQEATETVVVHVPAQQPTIEDAIAQISNVGKKLVIKVDPTKGEQVLPANIEAFAKDVTIRSSSSKPAALRQAPAPGPNTAEVADFDGPQFVDGVQPTISRVPLTLENVVISNVRGVVIDALDSVALENVSMSGKGTAVFTREHDANVQASLKVAHSRFEDVEIANIRNAFPHVDIAGNWVKFRTGRVANAVILGTYKDDASKVKISENKFIYEHSASSGSAVTVMRPNVIIADNVFDSTTPNVFGVEMIIPRPGRGKNTTHLVKNVQVTNNTFALKNVFVQRVPLTKVDAIQVKALHASPENLLEFTGNKLPSIKKAQKAETVKLELRGKINAKEVVVGKNRWMDGEA